MSLSDFQRGEAFSAAIDELVIRLGPPGLDNRELRVLSDLLVSTATSWVRERNIKASGKPRDECDAPMQECLAVLQKTPDIAPDVAANVLARVIMAHTIAAGGGVHHGLAAADIFAEGVKSALLNNWPGPEEGGRC